MRRVLQRRLLHATAAQCSARRRATSGTDDGKKQKDEAKGLTEEEKFEFERLAAKRPTTAREIFNDTMRRYDETKFIATTSIQVENLPAPIQKEASPMDEYKRSTTDFLSKLEPNSGGYGIGLGAGFGNTDDKKLTFFPSRKEALPELSEGLRDDQLTSEEFRQQRIALQVQTKQQLDQVHKKINAFRGSMFSMQEHFLLADLDFQRDSLLLGHTREDFEKNVLRLQNLVINYNKWERTDNRYRYGTWFLKAAVFFVMIESVQHWAQIRALEGGFEDFQTCILEDIAALTTKRTSDFATADFEVRANKPDYSSVIAAIRSEMKEQAKEEKPTDGTMHIRKDGLVLNHPLDTSGHAVFKVKTEEAERARQMSILNHHDDVESQADGAIAGLESRSLIGGIFSALFKSQKKEIIKVAGDDSSSDMGIARADLANFSYAVSPTSIESVRAVRRIVLPRADDFVSVVREEMLAYKNQKFAAMKFPT